MSLSDVILWKKVSFFEIFRSGNYFPTFISLYSSNPLLLEYVFMFFNHCEYLWKWAFLKTCRKPDRAGQPPSPHDGQLASLPSSSLPPSPPRQARVWAFNCQVPHTNWAFAAHNLPSIPDKKGCQGILYDKKQLLVHSVLARHPPTATQTRCDQTAGGQTKSWLPA